MLNETKELNSIAEEEIYYCYWTDNSHCTAEVTNDYMFELADKLTRSELEGELAFVDLLNNLINNSFDPNKLKSNNIEAGTQLRVPVSTEQAKLM